MNYEPQYLELSKMTDKEVESVLNEYKIGLTVDEARQVEKMVKRAPTATELIMFGIQGSEHCSYRSSRDHLKKLPTKGDHIMIGVGEDSGIVELAKDKQGRKYGVVLAHESHNHPSQIVPYEGAATGVGGVMRDIVCMGAQAIASMDPLRFGNIRKNETKWIYDNVVSGIAGYGNPLGVCNIGGDVYFDDTFQQNCLVNVVGVGFLREDEIIHSFAPKEAGKVGYDLILVGKPTDNSGMGGASFASIELKEEDTEANKGAVQEPNPFLEQHILTATYDLIAKIKEMGMMDKIGFKDLGAGGVMCSMVELADSVGFGAEIDLEKVHIALDIHPSVIACAETQERFAWACHPDLTDIILDYYNDKWALPTVSKGARASKVGKICTHDRFICTYGGNTYCDVLAKDLTSGLKYNRAYSKTEKTYENVNLDTLSLGRLKEQFLHLVGNEDICSRRPIYDNYDKHVQALTVLEAGVSDAGVMAPFWGRSETEGIEEIKDVGFALSVDSNPKYSQISSYNGAFNAVCESVRNIACVGAYPLALTDCLNYGSPEKEAQMQEFVDGIEGLKDAATQVGLITSKNPLPFISGNVSFYNQSGNKSVAPSAVVCCVGKVKDVKKSKTMDFKETGNKIYMLGQRKEELGGSAYYGMMGQLGTPEEVPIEDVEELKNQVKSMVTSIEKDLVLAAHDISDGGLAACLTEMVVGGNGIGKKGAHLDITCLDNNLSFLVNLFSETGGFVVEVSKTKVHEFEKICSENSVEFFQIGEVINEGKLTIWYNNEKINFSREELEENWLYGLDKK